MTIEFWGSYDLTIYCGKYISPSIYLRFQVHCQICEDLPCYFCLKPQHNGPFFPLDSTVENKNCRKFIKADYFEGS